MSDPITTAESDRLAAATLVAMEALRVALIDDKAALAGLADNVAKFSKAATSGASGYSGNSTSRDLSGEQRQLRLAEIMQRRQREAEDALLARERPGGTRRMQGPGATGLLLQKFSAILGPLQLFGQILQSNASGLQILSQATTLLAATIAPILLPAVLAAAAMLLDMSEDIQQQILPGLKEWARIIFSVVPILNELTSMFRAVIDTLAEFFVALKNGPQAIRDFFRHQYEMARGAVTGQATTVATVANAQAVLASRREGTKDADILKGAVRQGVSESNVRQAMAAADRADLIRQHRAAGTSDDEIRRKAAASGLKGDELEMAFQVADAERARAARDEAARPKAMTGAEAGGVAAAKGGGTGGARTPRSSLDDVLESFRQSIGPKATISSLGSVGSQAQLAALNGDPIQKRMADYLARIADATEAGAREARGTRPPVYGEGR